MLINSKQKHCDIFFINRSSCRLDLRIILTLAPVLLAVYNKKTSAINQHERLSTSMKKKKLNFIRDHSTMKKVQPVASEVSTEMKNETKRAIDISSLEKLFNPQVKIFTRRLPEITAIAASRRDGDRLTASQNI